MVSPLPLLKPTFKPPLKSKYDLFEFYEEGLEKRASQIELIEESLQGEA